MRLVMKKEVNAINEIMKNGNPFLIFTKREEFNQEHVSYEWWDSERKQREDRTNWL